MKFKSGYTLLCLIACLCYSSSSLRAQTESDERPLLKIEDGISFAKDSLFLLNLRFRIQNRAGFFTRDIDDLHIQEVEARVRRLRLRFDGYVLNKKIGYYIQLSFSRADQDLDNNIIAQTVRDAMIYYTFNPYFYIGFGQSKLPGNRQRVVSSGNLQMPDRSFVNQRMTLDRDFGLFAYFSFPLGGMAFNLKSAFTTGDGRNATAINDGVAHTHRIEWLPFGKFKDNGDYSEGDLAYEENPKLSLCVTYSMNFKSTRTGGQLGNDLYEERNIETLIADMIFKYKGWALQSEYIKRNTPGQSSITTKGESFRYVYSGFGINTQLSKLFNRKTELALRYTFINPEQEISIIDPARNSILAGLSRYHNGHRIKSQLFGGFEKASLPEARSFLSLMFQVEFGI
ncbi:MAG: porin [Flavobacteriales bacterium]